MFKRREDYVVTKGKDRPVSLEVARTPDEAISERNDIII